MGQKKRSRLKNRGPLFSEHHLKPKINGKRKGKKKITVPHSKHVAWHTLVKNSNPKEAALILSQWIDEDFKFFAVSKRSQPHEIVKEINEWLENEDFKLRVKRKSKIIRFSGYHTCLALALKNDPKLIIYK